MAAQVASAPAASGSKNKGLSGGLGQDLNSGKKGGGGGGGPSQGAGDLRNNVEHPRPEELSLARRVGSPANGSQQQSGNNRTSSGSASVSSTSPTMDAGLVANHKLRSASGDLHPPHHPAPHHFNQLQQHNQRSNHHNHPQGQGECDSQRGGKEHGLGSHSDQMWSKSGEEMPRRPGEQMGSRYEQGNHSGHGTGGKGSGSDFGGYFAGNSRTGPCFDQHGGQQGFGTSLMYPAADHVEPGPNSHEAYQGGQYGPYPGYRPGYGMLGQSSSGSASNHPKSTMPSCGSGVGGFQRFGGQNQHPPGATPTLNQLLTSPGPVRRSYGGGYYEYSSKDLTSQFGAPGHGWGGHTAHPGGSAGSAAQNVSRNQVTTL